MQEMTFDVHVKEWEELSTKHGKTSNEAGEYYDKHILPRVEKIFIENSKHRLEQKEYDGLILTVGRSPEPQILSLCAIAGESTQVGLLYTEAANDSLNRIFKAMKWRYSDVHDRAHRIDGSNTTEIYKTIMELHAEWEKCTETGKPKIAIGITGGKKVMASAAAMAGAILGADIYYVDTDTKNELNKPVPGSEYLRLLDNPYTVFGDLELQKAKDLCDRHDYAGAHRIFEQLEGQMRTPDQVTVYKAYKLLCATYEAWDNLNIKGDEGATNSLKELLEILEQYPHLPGLAPLHNFKEKLCKQKEALEHLSCIFENEQFAFYIPRGFHFAFMLYHNALRRAAQEKFDIACLILYRLLEWIGQHRLAIYGINTSKPTYSKLDYSKLAGVSTETDFFDLYRCKRKAIFPKDSESSSFPDKIALLDGFLILHALDDCLVKGYAEWGKFKGKLNIRNGCVYAHGMNKVGSDSFDSFKSTIEEWFCKARKLATDIDATVFHEQHEFIYPFPLP